MNDKLVTLAIRTYQRAQMIKAVLTNNGIPTEIHNLNLENPELAVGVRVRIKESDLPQALKIVESVEKEWEKETPKPKVKTILIPIDFGDMVDKTIDYGFNFAKQLNAEVIFLNVYYIPAFTITSNNDISTYSITDNDLLRRIISTANADIDNLKNLISKRIDKGELPGVKFKFVLKQGVPDEVIPEYCKKIKPDLIVMGTKGRLPTNELIGSVTAEVIETTNSPVFAIPSQINHKAAVKRIGFLTNFDQKDLIAIDKTIELFKSELPELFFIHASDKNDAWSEVMLGGIKTYFANHYPDLKTNYSLIASHNSPEFIDDFLQKNNIDLLAFNTRKRRLFSRLFNPGLAYKMVLHSNTMLFVTHV
jgi:nucleotide-binding universal stress UspA family protein